ncbi:MAG: hypothetical protein CME16_02950 [Gemmatimonadetes bacterium]|nr:hypothetical protein [Gemmatimonadota bacterium]|tara:strand:+ start:749 stop:1270 length:522 start_codon:yes stop_codon:yes gene_type:complete
MDFGNLINKPEALKQDLDVKRVQATARMSLHGATREEKKAALRKASKEFEAIFIYQMISAMRKTVNHGGVIKKSQGEKIFEGMLDEEWGKKLTTQNHHNGLGELLYRQMSRNLGLEEEKFPTRDEKGFMELIGTESSTRALPPNESPFMDLNRPDAQFLRLRLHGATEKTNNE